MKAFFLSSLLLCFFYSHAQKGYVGPPNNVGREYGNPKMPFVVSHLAGANKERLKRGSKNKHTIFSKILCFRRLCRIQSGHTASLRAISFKKFRKKVARNAKKGLYKKTQTDSTQRRTPAIREAAPVVKDTISVRPAPVIKADSLIILGAELLFETNKSTLKSEHFATLSSIVQYLVLHPERAVKISGHTDNTGNEQTNRLLSENRAKAVKDYLMNKGVEESRLTFRGYGSGKPLASNDSEEGRSQNRRVEFVITK